MNMTELKGVLRESTMSKVKIWLIGDTESELPQDVLPTTLEVLKLFFHYVSINKQTISQSANIVSKEVIQKWNQVCIPTKFEVDVVKKIKVLHNNYEKLRKSKSRKSSTQEKNEKSFVATLNSLFDVAHANSEKLIKFQNSKDFLNDQRQDRIMSMKNICQEIENHQGYSKKNEIRQAETNGNKASTSLELQFSSDSDDNVSVVENESDEEFKDVSKYHQEKIKSRSTNSETLDSCSPPKKPRIIENILNSADVSSVLDRINLSDNKCTMLFSAISRANGENLEEVAISRSTVNRRRSTHRTEINGEIECEFLGVEKPPLVVHWDGKQMNDTTNKENNKIKVDRLPVVVTGYETEKILGIPKLTSGKGINIANEIFKLLTKWKTVDNIVGMCFDTTASNAGSINGACHILENLIGKNLLHFACRHHIYELIIGSVFTSLFGPSSGPNIPLFSRFQKFWPNINKQKFESLTDLQLKSSFLKELRTDVLKYLQNIQNQKEDCYLPRDDYKEMVELCLIVLGELPEREYHFKIPGAYHLARWMAKVIYCFKIYLFREQFSLTSKENNSLTEFCLFASLIYVKAWLSCSKASDSPANDLLLFQQLKQYESVNKVLSEISLKKFKRHLWYLGPEMISLALFSNKVSSIEKCEIVKRLKLQKEDWSTRGIMLKSIQGLEKKSLHDLVGSSSVSALRLMLPSGIDFILKSDPETWDKSETFHSLKMKIDSFKVVNDVAERSVALMANFNESITKSEKEKQKLIQVVEDNRKRISDARKKTLATYPRRF